MIQNTLGLAGMVTAPHHAAAEAGRDVLREGGSAVEAIAAAAAVIAVVYPHMNAIGGDGFWLISDGKNPPVGIDACGPTGGNVDPSWFNDQELSAIPARGPNAAITVPGTISGWEKALAQPQSGAGRLPLSRLLAPAVELARKGFAMTAGQAELTAAKLDELKNIHGFADVFLDEAGAVPKPGTDFRQPALADTLEHLGRAGLSDFYNGDVARSMASQLTAVGAPLKLEDLEAFQAIAVTPLRLELPQATVFNMPPPTQGLASLFTLGTFERLGVTSCDDFDFVHGLVESTKQAFRLRDNTITDPDYMPVSAASLLTSRHLDESAANINPRLAAPWPQGGEPGDTVWLGAVDSAGRSVSFIQSIYWEYGSGVVLPETGVLMQNRGMSFGLTADHPHPLRPGRRPFHTLNPAMAAFKDGRNMVYGTMGGEGQPQTQSAIFTRYAKYGVPVQQAVTAPRWLLGRTWGDASTSLKMESRWSTELIDQLERAGHDVEVAGSFDSMMGHAGAIVSHPGGLKEGATDPRSDGGVSTS